MTGAQLIEEGRALARPCVYLDAMGDGEVVALWGGPGVAAPPEGDCKHWLSLNCRFLPENVENLTGCLSIYTDAEEGVAVLDSSQVLPRVGNGSVPLFGRPGISMPPIDAVFQFGSAAVQDWLRSYGWKPEWGCNDNFRGREVAAEYEAAFQKVSPLYRGGVFAQIGGWNIPWPEDDWAELLDQTLLVWTFQEAEPWIEVWLGKDQSLRVIQRVT